MLVYRLQRIRNSDNCINLERIAYEGEPSFSQMKRKRYSYGTSYALFQMTKYRT